MDHSPLRPRGFDDLGLKRALPNRLLPFLVAAMAFLAALALAGFFAAAGFAQHWREGAEAAVTIQVPSPAAPAHIRGAAHATRLERVLALLRDDPDIAGAKVLTAAELRTLLRPWLGTADQHLGLPLPAVVAVKLSRPGAPLTRVKAAIEHSAPGTLVESQSVWARRLSVLAASLQISAGIALLVVVAVAVTVVAVATHSGLAMRREAVEIVHGLGATDRYIAGRFAARAMRLAFTGGIAGALAALPVLLTLAGLASPFGSLGAPDTTAPIPVGELPPLLWFALPLLPLGAAAIGYLAAQVTVRNWLRRLP